MITAADLLGERPVRVSHARGVGRNELQVADVMTPIDAVAAMKLEDVRAAKVGHIVASLTQAGRQHGLVAEVRGPAEVSIRGIFSASQIARQLGVPLHIPELARTFAEVEQALRRIPLVFPAASARIGAGPAHDARERRPAFLQSLRRA